MKPAPQMFEKALFRDGNGGRCIAAARETRAGAVDDRGLEARAGTQTAAQMSEKARFGDGTGRRRTRAARERRGGAVSDRAPQTAEGGVERAPQVPENLRFGDGKGGSGRSLLDAIAEEALGVDRVEP